MLHDTRALLSLVSFEPLTTTDNVLRSLQVGSRQSPASKSERVIASESTPDVVELENGAVQDHMNEKKHQLDASADEPLMPVRRSRAKLHEPQPSSTFKFRERLWHEPPELEHPYIDAWDVLQK